MMLNLCPIYGMPMMLVKLSYFMLSIMLDHMACTPAFQYCPRKLTLLIQLCWF